MKVQDVIGLLKSDEVGRFWKSTSKLARSACAVAWESTLGHPCLNTAQNLCIRGLGFIPSPLPFIHDICKASIRLASKYILPTFVQIYSRSFHARHKTLEVQFNDLDHPKISSPEMLATFEMRIRVDDIHSSEPSIITHNDGSRWMSLPMTESCISSLVAKALSYSSENSAEVTWDADRKTQKLLDTLSRHRSSQNHRISILEKEIFFWQGSLNNGYNCDYGRDAPLFKACGVLHMTVDYLVNLLLDSDRVTSYNRWIIQRADSVIYQNCLNPDAGLGRVTKIIKSESRMPFTDRIMKLSSFVHAQRVQGGYVIVSRAVLPMDKEESTGTDVILGVNLIKSIAGRENESICEMTVVSHMKASFAPNFMAKKIGSTGLTQFFDELRKLVN